MDRGKICTKNLRHDPDTREVGNRKAWCDALLKKFSGSDQLFHHSSCDWRANHSFDARNRPTFLKVLDALRINLQRDNFLQRGVSVSLGVDGVGLCLLRFALRNAVMLYKILVQVGKPAVGLGGGECLLISADGRRKVG